MKRNKKEQKRLIVQIIAIVLILSMLISFAIPLLVIFA